MDFYADEFMPATDIVRTFAALSSDDSVLVAMRLRGKTRHFHHYHLGVMAIDEAGDLQYLHASNHPKDDTVLNVVHCGKYVAGQFPLKMLAKTRYMFIGGLVTGPHSVAIDSSNWPLMNWS